MSEKRLLGILGSPHVNGVTAAMLDCAVNTAQKNGWTVDQISLYEKRVAFCSGCRVCLQTGACVQHDDIQEIADLMKKCDIVILAAPVYWANVPAVVKNMFDRLLGSAMEETAAFPKPRFPGKTYLLMTACNTRFPFSWIFGQSRGFIRAADEFFHTAGMKCSGKFVCANTAEHKVPSKRMLRKIERRLRRNSLENN